MALETKFNLIKSMWTWFIGMAAIYQIAFVITICSGIGWSITSTVQDTRYNDLKAYSDKRDREFAEYRALSETREANSDRKHKEEVDYLKKGLENCEIEKNTMVKDVIKDVRSRLKDYELQRFDYDRKTTHEKR